MGVFDYPCEIRGPSGLDPFSVGDMRHEYVDVVFVAVAIAWGGGNVARGQGAKPGGEPMRKLGRRAAAPPGGRAH